jgi:hypothetical protein
MSASLWSRYVQGQSNACETSRNLYGSLLDFHFLWHLDCSRAFNSSIFVPALLAWNELSFSRGTALWSVTDMVL